MVRLGPARCASAYRVLFCWPLVLTASGLLTRRAGAQAPSAARGGAVARGEPLPALNQYVHDAWGVEHGLPRNNVRTITQTRDGYLWFGTLDGLVRFDGVRFTTFRTDNTPGMRGNAVASLAAGRDGSLWAATSGGLLRYRDGRVRTYTTADGLARDMVIAVHEDRAGRVWAGGYGGLSRLDGERFTSYTARDGLPAAMVYSIDDDDQDGTLLVGTVSGGLVRMAGGRLSSVATPAQLPNGTVRAAARGADGTLWVATSGGLAWTADVPNIAAPPPITALRAFFGRDPVNTLARDRGGRLWVGGKHGLARLDPGGVGGGVATFDDSAERALGSVSALYEDREGSVWIGTFDRGLHRLRRGAFASYPGVGGLGGSPPGVVCEDAHGVVWVGSERGLTALRDGRPVRSYGASDGVGAVGALANGPDGSLWLGTPLGVTRLRDGRFSRYTARDGLLGGEMFALAVERDGTVAVGTSSGLTRLTLGPDGRVAHAARYTRIEGLADNTVHALAAARDGGLWVGTAGGLHLFRDGRLSTYTKRDGLSHEAVVSLHEDPDGALWIGTFGGGLDHLAGGRLTAWGTRQGLASDVVWAIVPDGRGALWLSGMRGVSSVRVQDLVDQAAGRRARVSPAVYDTHDGLASAQMNGGYGPTAWRAHDGRLWFADGTGVAVVDPAHLPHNPLPPPVRVEEVVADGRPLPVDAPLAVAPDTRRLDILYTALSLRVPERVRFRYRLEGFDDRWVDAGAERVAHFTGLRPGRYRFHVTASNDAGVWNPDGAAVTVRALPRFYQTPWFAAAAAAVLGASSYAAYLLRRRALEQRFALVLAERTRIARELHDSLLQGFTGVSMQVQAAVDDVVADDAPARARFEAVLRQADLALAHARSAVGDMRLSTVSTADLGGALDELAARAAREGGLAVRLDVDGAARPLRDEVRVTLLRVAQEALANVVRHARARSAEVALHHTSRAIRLVVRDDGAGFAADEPARPGTAPAGHWGIVGMRERAAAVGGTLVVRSAPGAGTEVQLEVPTLAPPAWAIRAVQRIRRAWAVG